MRTGFYFDSCGEGRIHGCRWTPEGRIRAVVQIIHGIAEFVERYDDFVAYLNSKGILVVAEDHMGHGKSMETGTQGYFAGGWTAAVDDSYRLLRDTKAEFPDVPYILFGHSMGSLHGPEHSDPLPGQRHCRRGELRYGLDARRGGQRRPYGLRLGLQADWRAQSQRSASRDGIRLLQ